MKFALLGLALTATVAQGQNQYNSPGYARQDRLYGEEPSNGQEQPTGYGVRPSGYGKPPVKQPGYRNPASTGDHIKRHFDQYYDNLKFCAAETSLAQCIIASQSRQDCVSEGRINICTNQFVNNLCSSIESTTTGTYDNGYFKATANTCVDAALADSILVYNKLIRESDNALIAAPQFDEWSFAGIKLALSTTRTHADCVIKSFFNYLNGCAKARALKKKDLECLNVAMKSTQCEFGKETGDGWNLPGYLNFYKTFITNLYASEPGVIKPTSDADKKIIDDLLKEVSFQGVQVVNGEYDYINQRTSVNVINKVAPTKTLTSLGTSIEELKFHFPVGDEAKTVWETKSDSGGAQSVVTIYKQCNDHFRLSRDNLEKALNGEWKQKSVGNKQIYIRINDENEYECIAKDDACKSTIDDEDKKGKNVISCKRNIPTPPATENPECPAIRSALNIHDLSDKCFSYNGFSIAFLDNGSTIPLEIEKVFDKSTPPSIQYYKASWSEPHSCNSHLTQWKQSIACCKSYATALREYQSSWDKRNKNNGGYSKGTKPNTETRPTVLPESFDGTKTVFEKILTSSDKASSSEGAVKEFTQQTLPDIANLKRGVEKLETRRFKKLLKIAKQNPNFKFNEKDALLYPEEHSGSTESEPTCYLSSSKTYASICSTLKRSWEPETVIPIVNAKCIPQACVLSQLSKCADIPEKKAGYDYVAQPQPGYNGYRPSYIYRNTLSLESASTVVLAVSGFASGAFVVVIAQYVLKARGTTSTSSAEYLLV